MKNKTFFILFTLLTIYALTMLFITPKAPKLITSTQVESTQLKKDINQLAQLITLPIKPSKAVWYTKTQGVEGGFLADQNDWTLRAALFYSSAQYNQVKRQSKPHSNATPSDADYLFYSYLKEAQSSNPPMPEMNKREANLFYQSPLIHGSALFIDDEHLVLLSLFTQ